MQILLPEKTGTTRRSVGKREQRSTMLWMRAVGPGRRTLAKRFGPAMADSLSLREPRADPLARIGAATDPGGRAENEDSAVVLVSKLAGRGKDRSLAFAAVTDGMGGHVSGDRASAVAITTITEYVADKFIFPDAPPKSQVSGARIFQVLGDAVKNAHLTVMDEAPGGGTTATCVLVRGRDAYIAHVGDSRLMIFDEDGGRGVTRDHLVVRRLQEMGLLTDEQAANHPHRNILYRAVGVNADFGVDLIVQPLQPGSRVLLCSDGVWGVLSLDVMLELIVRASDCQEACDMLVNAAVYMGALDNVTAAMIQIPH